MKQLRYKDIRYTIPSEKRMIELIVAEESDVECKAHICRLLDKHGNTCNKTFKIETTKQIKPRIRPANCTV